jgi:hypothetical protein
MKKVSFFYNKRLQHLLSKDEEFRKTQMHHYALALANYMVELSIVREPVPVSFPIIGGFVITPSDDVFAVLKEAHEKTSRVEVHLFAGIADACIGLDMVFLSRATGGPLLKLLGGIDSMRVRKLDMTMCDELESVAFFENNRFTQAIIGKGP